jgi:hypothetical protein
MSAKNTKVSPRIRIRETDSLKTTRSKSTESGLSVGNLKPFSEDRVLIFDETTVVYPTMLPSGSAMSDVAGIVTVGRVRPGTSDVHSTIENEIAAPYIEHRNDTTGEAVSGLGMSPSFSGSLGSRTSIKIDITAREDSYIYRCPKRHIDADPAGEFQKEGTGFAYFNFVTRRWDHVGNSYNRKNFSNLGEDRIITDQVHVISASLHGPTSRSLGIQYVATGSENYAGQFVPPDFFSTRGFTGDNAYKTLRPANFDDKIAMGAHKTGTPTISHYAPASTKYYASSSNVIRMSDYISEPFLLEKIKIQLPVVARRIHQSSSMDSNGFWSQCNDLHSREMDNYVVFLYRQVRNFTGLFPESPSNRRDTYEDSLKSVRFLIASASMCFYNLPTHVAGINGIAQDPGGTTFGFSNVIFGPRDVEDPNSFFPYFDSTAVNGSYNTDSFPYHTPQFKHDFNMPVISSTSSIAPKQIGLFTGSITLVMEPSISPAGRAGSRRMLVFSSSIKTGDETYYSAAARKRRYLGLNKERIVSYLQHAWPGTAGVYPFGGFEGADSYSGRTLFNNLPSHFRTTYVRSSLDTPVELLYTTLTNVDIYRNTFTDSSVYNVGGPPTFTNTQPVGFRDAYDTFDVSLPDVRSLTGVFGPAESYAKAKLETDLDDGSFMLGETSFSDTGARSKPIILLPTDELILGIDAGIVPFRADSSTITGSFIKIEAKGAEITLFGSQIVNGEKRQHYGKSQTLGGALGVADVAAPVADEFLLEPHQTTYGNYHAPLATGSLLERVVQNYAAIPPVFPLSTPIVFKGLAEAFGTVNPVDWYAYPRYVTLIDDRAKVIDAGTTYGDTPNMGAPSPVKYIFRNDKFGQTAHMMASYTGAAMKLSKDSVLPTSNARKRVVEDFYPITNVFTGSTVITKNTSLHASSSGPFFDL